MNRDVSSDDDSEFYSLPWLYRSQVSWDGQFQDMSGHIRTGAHPHTHEDELNLSLLNTDPIPVSIYVIVYFVESLPLYNV